MRLLGCRSVCLLVCVWALLVSREKPHSLLLRAVHLTRVSAFKDGDMSTSWTCTGDPKEDDDYYYDCNLYFNMVYYRHLKQIKIGAILASAEQREMFFRATQDVAGRRARLEGECH